MNLSFLFKSTIEKQPSVIQMKKKMDLNQAPFLPPPSPSSSSSQRQEPSSLSHPHPSVRTMAGRNIEQRQSTTIPPPSFFFLSSAPPLDVEKMQTHLIFKTRLPLFSSPPPLSSLLVVPLNCETSDGKDITHTVFSLILRVFFKCKFWSTG